MNFQQIIEKLIGEPITHIRVQQAEFAPQGIPEVDLSGREAIAWANTQPICRSSIADFDFCAWGETKGVENNPGECDYWIFNRNPPDGTEV
jgi:hypothetical protein